MRRSGRIEIRDLRAVGIHGVLDEERVRAQPFSLDLDVWFDTGPAAASDCLDDTVDYGAVASLATKIVSSTSFRLLEALASDVAGKVMASDPRIERVSVTARKLRPPVPADIGSIGVRVVCARDAKAQGGGDPRR
jgi:7,8-dihydroneopterin aldolase/epimerase/oxygenase